MKIKQFIDITQEIEVDIRLDEIFDYLAGLPKENELFWCLDAANMAAGILHRIPDDVIATMGEGRRKLIYNALKEQLKRYETGPVNYDHWKPATPFG